MKRREFITLLGGALSAFHCVSASAQEGYYGAGHDKWHQGFYSTLKRNDGKGSCCNLMDCRPTQSRMIGDHYATSVRRVKRSLVWSPFRLLWVAGLGRRFERPNTGQRNRRGLSAAADALKPPIELSRLDLMGGVRFAHWVLAYISGSIPSRSTIPTSAIALSEGQLSMKLDSMASNGDE